MSCAAIALAERGRVVVARDAVAAHGDTVVGDVDPFGIESAPLAPSSERMRPQYGIVAVERALHELAVGDAAGREAGVGVGTGADDT